MQGDDPLRIHRRKPGDLRYAAHARYVFTELRNADDAMREADRAQIFRE